MTSSKLLTALAGIGIGLAVLFSFVALILAGATLRKLNNQDGTNGANSALAASARASAAVVASTSGSWSYGEGSSACGDCLSATLLAGQTYPAGTVRLAH